MRKSQLDTAASGLVDLELPVSPILVDPEEYRSLVFELAVPRHIA